MSVAIVLSLDHWNAGLAGFGGGEPLLMPHVDRLAARSAVFDRCSGIESGGQTSDPRRTWARDWQSLLDDGVGLKVLVEAEDVSERDTVASLGLEIVSEISREDLVGAAVNRVDWLCEKGASNRLLWVAMSAPWGIDDSDGAEWPDGLEEIDRALGRFDEVVGAVLEAMEQKSARGEVLVMVTGGTGAWLGDRGFEDPDRAELHEDRLRTPLVLQAPGVAGGQRRLELVQVSDLCPTLSAWFGGPAESDAGARREEPGVDLLQLLRGETGAGHDALVFEGAHGERAIRTADLFLVHGQRDGEPFDRLFSKPGDAWDLVDVSGQGMDDVERLRARLAGEAGSGQDHGDPISDPGGTHIGDD